MSESHPSSSQRPRNSIFTLIMVCAIVVVMGAVLLVLPTGFIGPVMVLGGILFFGMIGFHYVVWGRWLARVLREEAADETDSE